MNRHLDGGYERFSRSYPPFLSANLINAPQSQQWRAWAKTPTPSEKENLLAVCGKLLGGVDRLDSGAHLKIGFGLSGTGGLVLAPLGVLVDAGAHGQNECDGNCDGAHDEHRGDGVEHGFEHHTNPLHEQAAGDTGNTGKGQSHE